MRRILLSTIKILISAALLYLSLRKVNLYDLAARIRVESLGWIGLAIAVTFLQIFLGVLRWREISAECGAPLETRQAMRFNVIGTFFNQTLPSSIGGDAVRLWLVARSGAGWRAATYSIFVDRAIGLIALAVLIVASLPWSYRLISDPHGRSALLLIDFAALAAGGDSESEPRTIAGLRGLAALLLEPSLVRERDDKRGVVSSLPADVAPTTGECLLLSVAYLRGLCPVAKPGDPVGVAEPLLL
jgi:uncharacterized membrane protein YbhN (UPF0104 family)